MLIIYYHAASKIPVIVKILKKCRLFSNKKNFSRFVFNFFLKWPHQILKRKSSQNFLIQFKFQYNFNHKSSWHFHYCATKFHGGKLNSFDYHVNYLWEEWRYAFNTIVTILLAWLFSHVTQPVLMKSALPALMLRLLLFCRKSNIQFSIVCYVVWIQKHTQLWIT